MTVGSNKAATSASPNPNDQINAAGYDLLDSRVIVERVGASTGCRGRSTSRRTWRYYAGQPLRRIYTITRTVVPALRQTSQDVQLLPAGDVRKPDQTLLDVRLGRRFRGARRSRSSRSSRSTTC